MTPLGAYLWLTTILLLCGLGLPIPEDISLIAAGYFSYKGVLDINTAFAVCFAAVLAGDTLAFLLGRFFGRRVLASPFARRYFTPQPAAARARLFPQVRQQGGADRPVHAGFPLHDLLHGRHAAPAAVGVPGLRLLGGGVLGAGAGLLGLVLRRADRSRRQVHAPDRARHPGGDRRRARCGRHAGLPAAQTPPGAAARAPGRRRRNPRHRPAGRRSDQGARPDRSPRSGRVRARSCRLRTPVSTRSWLSI